MGINYQELGFRCGLEIHQQLDTKKLFCNCPSIIKDANPDIIVRRRLKASASELGEIDVAAIHEMSKKKEMIYEAHSSNVCLVELDEEPPDKPNQKAVEIALEAALLLKAKVLDQLMFMRKVVIDGSNVSGFQRTALIAINGQIETSKGLVKIPVIMLEEEAAKKISQDDDSVKYRLDRLGIPLIEIATDDSIKDAEHAKEVAEKIGMILRSTGKVLRGLGTIRQDVNVSIKNGARTEIKGFQELKSIPKVIDFEIERQLDLIKKGIRINEEVRKAESNLTTSFLRPMPGSARLYPETDVISINIDSNFLKKIKLPELIEDKLNHLERQYHIRKDIINKLIKENKLDIFERLVKDSKELKAPFLADFLLSYETEVKKNDKADVSRISNSDVILIIKELDDGAISRSSLNDILIEVALGKNMDIEKYKLIDENILDKEIKEIISKNIDKNTGALMGIIMGKYKGKVDGKKVMQILKKYEK